MIITPAIDRAFALRLDRIKYEKEKLDNSLNKDEINSNNISTVTIEPIIIIEEEENCNKFIEKSILIEEQIKEVSILCEKSIQIETNNNNDNYFDSCELLSPLIQKPGLFSGIANLSRKTFKNQMNLNNDNVNIIFDNNKDEKHYGKWLNFINSIIIKAINKRYMSEIFMNLKKYKNSRKYTRKCIYKKFHKLRSTSIDNNNDNSIIEYKYLYPYAENIFNKNMIRIYISRLGKEKLAILFNKWRIKRLIIYYWINFIINKIREIKI
jgi:hypothetical protein